MSNPLDDFLDGGFTGDANDALQHALRQRTTQVLRRRRRFRQFGFAGLAAACYAAGLATMWVVLPRPAAMVERPQQPLVIAENKNQAPVEAKSPEPAAFYEFEAYTVPPEQRAAQLRKAGDLYLEQERDYASALRCYTQAFDAGGAKALEFSPDDNWLVMAIKNARRKEMIHAQ
jgi:hypothetical protein